MSELSRILKPGGELILSVPYKSKYQQKYIRNLNMSGGYTKEELKELVQTCNMEIKKVYYYQRWFGNILFKVYNALSQKVLIGLLFYPFYGLYLLDYYFGRGGRIVLL